MIDQRFSTVSITRSLGYTAWLRPLYVCIDGERVGKVLGNRTKEFPVTAGEHLVRVSLSPRFFATLPISLRDYDCIELICTTDAVQLHPWHIHASWVLLIFSFVWFPLGAFIPPIRVFMNKLLVEMQMALVMSVIGMMLYFWRVHKAGAWRLRPAIYLTFVEPSSGEESDDERF